MAIRSTHPACRPGFFPLALAISFLIGAFSPAGAAENQLLWQIGTVNNNDFGFALAHGEFGRFPEKFGHPDRAFYVGLCEAQTDWPCVLPGVVDAWAGSRVNSARGLKWDAMNTLPIGFVLQQTSGEGDCRFTINFCDSAPQNPPRVRVTVNGAVFERPLLPGGSERSLVGDFSAAKPQTMQVRFPASLLQRGYNEITLRTVEGSWALFDALRLDAPAGVVLAPPAQTVIRDVSAAPHAVSSDAQTPATVRVEVYRKDFPANLSVQIGDAPTQTFPIEAGLQVLEIPAPVSAKGQTTHIRLSENGQLLSDSELNLPASPAATPADYVDVFLGTEHARWMFGPGPWMPNSMVKLSPDNQPQGWCAGYQFSHEYIDCFSHIHEWTMGGLGMMPTVGPLRTHPGLDDGYSSRIDKSSEHGGIGFYEVVLKDSGIKVELTATTRASLQRYTFPADSQARVLFPFLLANEYQTHVISAKVRRTGPGEIEGDIQTMVGPNILGMRVPGCNQTYVLHFVSQFSRPFDEMGGWKNLAGPNVTIKVGDIRPAEELNGWQGGQVLSNVQALDLSGDCGAFVNFKTGAGEAIEVRSGISLVSVDDARQNLDQELSTPFGWDFAAVMQNQRNVWNQLFHGAEIQTPDAREKTRFYSNFYRALSDRNIWSDINGQWIDPYGRVQKLTDPDSVMLGSDALWTTFWNLNPMMNLLAPQWSARWVKSELQLYDHCGWLSKGPAGLKYLSIMVAEHEIPLMVAACQAGISGLDQEKVLAAAVKMQTTPPQDLPGGQKVGNENLEGYLKYGYVPADGPLKGPTSNTLNYAYDDWTVAQLALALGHKQIADEFLNRSRFWRNTFDATTGFARPRMMDGRWLTPFDPIKSPGFTEGNCWQYTYFVPQDVPGLVAATGRDRFIKRLNDGFEESIPFRFNATNGQDGQYLVDQGNEQAMHISWLFNWASAPWLTQKWTRAILDAYYGYGPADAYLGDEDQGQMSSWFIMSAMGLYQIEGGCRVDPIYELASPLYPKITLHLSDQYYGGKTFTIEARNASAANRYIQSATLNGKPLDQWWIREKDLIQGGSLVLEMGPTPNKNWAVASPPAAQ